MFTIWEPKNVKLDITFQTGIIQNCRTILFNSDLNPVHINIAMSKARSRRLFQIKNKLFYRVVEFLDGYTAVQIKAV